VSSAAAYLALLAGIVVWALLVRKLTTKPWEFGAVEQGGVEELPNAAPARVGLWVFLGVVTSLFALFMSAYYMRMGHGHGEGLTHDWHPLIEPPILWVNSVLLIAASVAMQRARWCVSQQHVERARDALIVGGLLTAMFLCGQVYAWSTVLRSGEFNATNPAVAFFYVITAVHGLHLVGGLVVWARTLRRMIGKRPEPIDVRLSIELCTTYWHFLLIVWLVLFVLLLLT